MTFYVVTMLIEEGVHDDRPDVTDQLARQITDTLGEDWSLSFDVRTCHVRSETAVEAALRGDVPW